MISRLLIDDVYSYYSREQTKRRINIKCKDLGSDSEKAREIQEQPSDEKKSKKAAVLTSVRAMRSLPQSQIS